MFDNGDQGNNGMKMNFRSLEGRRDSLMGGVMTNLTVLEFAAVKAAAELDQLLLRDHTPKMLELQRVHVQPRCRAARIHDAPDRFKSLQFK